MANQKKTNSRPRRNQDFNPKVYNFEIRCYCNPNKVIANLTNVQRYAYVLHDRDVDVKSCELKQAHYHIIVTFVNPRFLSGLQKTLEAFFSTLTEDYNFDLLPCSTSGNNDIVTRFRYLRHADDDSKYQYSLQDIVSNDIGWYTQLEASRSGDSTDPTETNKMFISDLLTLPTVLMGIRYGRDFIKNYQSYKVFAEHVKYELGGANEAYNYVVNVSNETFESFNDIACGCEQVESHKMQEH